MTGRLAATVIFAIAVYAGTAMAGAAETQADRMLAAVGGRDAWAALTNTINDSQQNRMGEPAVLRSIITMDFDRPRFRIDTVAPGLNLSRAIDGERHWRLTREGKVEPLPQDFLDEEMDWYAGHVYRTIHRIAKRDPALSLVEGEDGRLEVHEGGKQIAWYKLDSRGEPYRFGKSDNEVGAISGPWDVQVGKIKHPAWVSNPEGTWRAMVKSLKTNVKLDDAVFAPPAPGK